MCVFNIIINEVYFSDSKIILEPWLRKYAFLKSGVSSIMTGIHFDSEFQISITVVTRSKNYKVIVGIKIPKKLGSKEEIGLQPIPQKISVEN